MLTWKPRLVVRRGRGGSIASPVTTVGYVLNAAATMAVSVVFGVITQSAWALVCVVPVWLAFRDAAAWLLATPLEREQFRAECSWEDATSVFAPSPSQIVVEEGRAPRMAFFLVAGGAAVVAGFRFHPALLVLATFFLALGALNALDVLRAPRKP